MQNVRAIEFDENGVPVPVLKQPITGARMTRLLAAALTQPYVPMRDEFGCIKPGEEEFEGLTNVEVGSIRQAREYAWGDGDAAKFVFDRVVGKPTQQVQQLTVTTSLQEYLQQLATKDNMFGDASGAEEVTDAEYMEDADAGPTPTEPAPLAIEKTPEPVVIKIPEKFAALDGI